MLDKIVLISKDVLRADYLAPYGNKYWETPNVCALADRGTIFRRHYAAAPSSAMAYTCMFSGLNAYELNRATWKEVDDFNQASTLFETLAERGYACHIIWDEVWHRTAYRYSKCFGRYTEIHDLDIQQCVGPHRSKEKELIPNPKVAEETMTKILREVDEIRGKMVFIWIHLPHVLKGRAGYGHDIDLFDQFIGHMRTRFGDEAIYVTSDHGHMNLEKGMVVYGFNGYEGEIWIPLITPRLEGMAEVTFPTSSIQLKEIILEGRVTKLEYVFSDTQYYAQARRRLVIIKDEYKYIYSKDGREELYDLKWDRGENLNLLQSRVVDRDRGLWYRSREVCFYPYYEQAQEYYQLLLAKRDEIWERGSFCEEILGRIRNVAREFRSVVRRAQGPQD